MFKSAEDVSFSFVDYIKPTAFAGNNRLRRKLLDIANAIS